MATLHSPHTIMYAAKAMESLVCVRVWTTLFVKWIGAIVAELSPSLGVLHVCIARVLHPSIHPSYPTIYLSPSSSLTLAVSFHYESFR